MTTHSVLISGAGPTGLMLAAELALANIDVAIIERRTTQERIGPGALGLHSRSIEVLGQRGVAERFISQGTTYKAVHFQIPIDISDFPTRHNYTLGLKQIHIERILAEWVDELKAPILRGREVAGFTQDESGVDVTLADGERLRAEYLVGCDGGRTAFVLQEAQVQSGSSPTLDDLKSALVAVYGTDFGVHSPAWISRFTDMTRQAAAFRDRRVLLAGDAAHIHAPLGGQGLNIGLQDAVNLGWKLAQVIKRTSPASLLDTYHAERHPVAARASRNTMAHVAVRRTDERTRALGEITAEIFGMDEPRRWLGGMMTGLDVRYDLGEGHPLLGRRMPDLDVVTADGTVRVGSVPFWGILAGRRLIGPVALDIRHCRGRSLDEAVGNERPARSRIYR